MFYRKTPTTLAFPAYMMNFPFTVDNREVNNVLMEAYRNQKYDYNKAFAQFMKMYSYFTQHGLVYVLPSDGDFQDQTYVANVGCYLPHVRNDTVVLANFKSEPRRGEELIAKPFFQGLGYTVVKPSTTFEGEADLKWLRDNIYVGGYGIRTDRDTYRWLEETTGAEITTVEMYDGGLYHFDCMFLPLTKEKALVAVSAIRPEDLRKLEKLVEIIPVPNEYLYDAWTNCIVYGKTVMGSPAHPEWCDFIAKQGMEPVRFDLSEFEKSGAAASCLVMHLNYGEL